MDIYCAARSGDLERVRYLCEVEEVDLNRKNEYDSIPLFYACLCGHTDVVVYLLDHGAILDSNTFEGERCYYAALTDEIETILRTYKAKPAINPLTEKLKLVFKQGLFSDIMFCFSESLPQDFKLHKFILSAKSEYFAQMFNERWELRKKISFNNPLLKAEAFRALTEYLYTNTLNIAIEYSDSLKLLCKQCRLNDLESLVDQECESANRRTLGRIIIDRNIYASHENFHENLEYYCTLWNAVRRLYDPTLPEENLAEAKDKLFTDICLLVDGQRFYTHRVLLCAQSEYFRSMLCGNFRESSGSSVIELPEISKETFFHVMEYVYTNFVQELEQDMVLDLLSVADQLLMPTLKNLCVRQIVEFVDTTNVVEFLQIAEMYNSDRLRGFCEDLIEENLGEMMEAPELKDYLLTDGASVKFLKEKIKDLVELPQGQVNEWRPFMNSLLLPPTTE